VGTRIVPLLSLGTKGERKEKKGSELAVVYRDLNRERDVPDDSWLNHKKRYSTALQMNRFGCNHDKERPIELPHETEKEKKRNPSNKPRYTMPGGEKGRKDLIERLPVTRCNKSTSEP